jgi:hypothetical protein
MAQIWMQRDAGEWQAIAIDRETCALAETGPSPIGLDVDCDGPGAASESAGVRLRRLQGAGGEAWALVASRASRVLVNGLPVRHGLAVLADRDEIRALACGEASSAAWLTCFFSTERLATVEPFPSTGRRGSCPRCKQPLTPGEAAVRCPGCGLWHHATEDWPCWTHVEVCAVCDQPTALDTGFRWTPEDL